MRLVALMVEELNLEPPDCKFSALTTRPRSLLDSYFTNHDSQGIIEVIKITRLLYTQQNISFLIGQ